MGSLFLPRIMRIGAGASKSLPAVLTALNLKRPLIVTDSFFSTRLAPLTDALDEAGFDHHTFAGCVPDPTTDSCAQGLDALRSAPGAPIDCLVGYGGGSSMDTAKAIAAQAVDPRPLSELKFPTVVTNAMPVIAVPTTTASAPKRSACTAASSFITDVANATVRSMAAFFCSASTVICCAFRSNSACR